MKLFNLHHYHYLQITNTALNIIGYNTNDIKTFLTGVNEKTTTTILLIGTSQKR